MSWVRDEVTPIPPLRAAALGRAEGGLGGICGITVQHLGAPPGDILSTGADSVSGDASAKERKAWVRQVRHRLRPDKTAVHQRAPVRFHRGISLSRPSSCEAEEARRPNISLRDSGIISGRRNRRRLIWSGSDGVRVC